MPRTLQKKILPFSDAQMFALVGDVARYPEFLPWVVATRIRESSAHEMLADLVVGFKVFRESFTSRVHLEPSGRIHIDYVDGPFKYLHNDWRFIAHKDGCEISCLVDFEFKNRMFEMLVGHLFSDATNRMVAAFEARAHHIYKKTNKP